MMEMGHVHIYELFLFAKTFSFVALGDTNKGRSERII